MFRQSVSGIKAILRRGIMQHYKAPGPAKRSWRAQEEGLSTQTKDSSVIHLELGILRLLTSRNWCISRFCIVRPLFYSYYIRKSGEGISTFQR
jgi:hypothetical protein